MMIVRYSECSYMCNDFLHSYSRLFHLQILYIRFEEEIIYYKNDNKNMNYISILEQKDI